MRINGDLLAKFNEIESLRRIGASDCAAQCAAAGRSLRHARHTDRRAAAGGFALVAVLMLMVLLLGMGAALHSAALSDISQQGALNRATVGFYAAEAGVNRGMADYRNIFLNYSRPMGSDFNVRQLVLGDRTVSYQLTEVPGNPTSGIVPAGRQYAGLSAMTYRYIARSTSQLVDGEDEASLGTEFDVEYVPLFQFLAFYQNDLEILPGPNAVLHGPIHTNGNLYLNSDNTLQVADLPPQITAVHVTAAGDINRGRKDTTACTGTVQLAKLADGNNDGRLDTLAMACAGNSSPQSASQLSPYLGAVMAHVAPLTAPRPDQIRYLSGDFWRRADLRIALDVDLADEDGLIPIVVLDGDGNIDDTRTAILRQFMNAKPGRIFYNDVPTQNHTNATACNQNDSYCNPNSYRPNFSGPAARMYGCAQNDLLAPAVCPQWLQNENVGDGSPLEGYPTARRGGFYNVREAAWVRMLNVNVHDLIAWNRLQPMGNQLFDPDDATDAGVVLFLTVVAPGQNGLPIDQSHDPPRRAHLRLVEPRLPRRDGRSDGPDCRLRPGHLPGGQLQRRHGANPKMPAALIGDSINVLSTNWTGPGACQNDCQSRQVIGQRLAAATTIYTAFLGGTDTTAGGNYNGGLENYPRFHEDWSGGRVLFYRGSFVSLGNPVHANGRWSSQSYSPPVRNWDFDTDFMQVELLPPLTPRAVNVEQILFTQNFR